MVTVGARRDAPAPLRYPDRIGNREPDTMKTDWSIYELLATGPEAFRVLSDGVTLSGAYRFGSVTLKSIERRLDGVHEPEDHAGPVYISEFQAYVAVFAPLIVRRTKDLRTRAPAVWRTLQAAPLEPAVRATLERIFESWLIERLPTLTTQELRTMLPVLVPLEQTRIYQEIFAEGEAAGKIEGQAEGEAKGKAEGEAKGKAEGKADGLKRLLARRFGPLPAWAVRRLETAALEQLDDWLDGFLDAQSLEALLGPAPRRGRAKPKP